MHIILQNLPNLQYKSHRKQKVLQITIYQLVRQKVLQKNEIQKYKRKK
jgi:hypothetical protein